MTDKELSKKLKKLGFIFILMIILIVTLSVYTLGSTKAELSIYSKNDIQNSLKIYGIEEEEFKKYLSIFGNLIEDKNYSEEFRTIEMATEFIDNLCSAYKAQENENRIKEYDSEIVNKVIKEISGTYIKENIDINDKFVYDSENKTYKQIEEIDRNPYCIEIENINKSGEKIEVIYKLAIMTNDEIAKYSIGQDVDIKIFRLKAVILENADYEYSKYFVSYINMI